MHLSPRSGGSNLWAWFIGAFQWIIGRISGRSISVVSVIKAVMYESGYFVLSMLILLVILVLFGLAYETFF